MTPDKPRQPAQSASEPDNFYVSSRPWLIRLWCGGRKIEQERTGTYAQVEQACAPIPAGALITLHPLNADGEVIPDR